MDLSQIIAQIGQQQQNPVAPQITPPDMASSAPQQNPGMTLEQKIAAFNAINPSHVNLPSPHIYAPPMQAGGAAPQAQVSAPMPPPDSAPPTAAPMPQQGLAAPPPVNVVPTSGSTSSFASGGLNGPNPIRKGAGLGTNLIAWLMNKATTMQGPH